MLDFVSANGADVTLGLPDGFLYGQLTFSKTGGTTGKVTGGAAGTRATPARSRPSRGHVGGTTSR